MNLCDLRIYDLLTFEECNFVYLSRSNFDFRYSEAIVEFDLLGYWSSLEVNATHFGTEMPTLLYVKCIMERAKMEFCKVIIPGLCNLVE